MVYKIFTLTHGHVEEGARIDAVTLKDGETRIPAIVVGGTGRGKELALLAVQLLPDQYQQFKNGEEVRVYAGALGQTRSGRPKLIEAVEATTTDAVIAVFKSPLSYKGWNEYRGDWVRVLCAHRGQVLRNGTYCPECKLYWADAYWGDPKRAIHPDRESVVKHEPFPLEIIVEGFNIPGLPIKSGQGRELVTILPEGKVVRVGYNERTTNKGRSITICGMVIGSLRPHWRSAS